MFLAKIFEKNKAKYVDKPPATNDDANKTIKPNPSIDFTISKIATTAPFLAF